MNFLAKISNSKLLTYSRKQKRRQKVSRIIVSAMLCVTLLGTNMMGVSATETSVDETSSVAEKSGVTDPIHF